MNKQLDQYYNTFNEDKRLLSRHGRLEFQTSMHYIDTYLSLIEQTKPISEIRILDVGAGTGAYTIPLSERGYDVTAVELSHPNLGRLKQKATKAHVLEGNAINLKRFSDSSFDLVILFGPLYHLKDRKDQLSALSEAKRVLRPDGYLFTTYIMNEYAILTYAFTEGNYKRCLEEGRMDSSYHCCVKEDDLYNYMRIEDIDSLNSACELTLLRRFSQAGPANYMRRIVNAMDEETYRGFCQYHLATCERADLFGASSHIADILKK